MLRLGDQWPLSQLAEVVLWWGLVGVLVVVGLLGGYRAFRQQALGAPGAWETTDAWLASADVAYPSATLRASLVQPPDEGAVLFVGSADDPTFPLTYYVISYLGWPRLVGALQCGAQRQAMPYVPIEDHITTVLFYRREAPSFLGQPIAIGPYIRQVSEREKRDWTKYCSR